MKPFVSKRRTEKTRTRERKAGRTAAAPRPWTDHPAIRIALGIALWLLAVLLCGFEPFVSVPTQVEPLLAQLGAAAFLLVGLFTAVLFLKLTRPALLFRNPDILLLAGVATASLLAAKFMLYVMTSLPGVAETVNGFVLPFVMAPILAAILIDGVAAIAVGGWTVLAMCLMTGNQGIPLLMSGLVAVAVAAASAPQIRTRTRVMRIGLIAGLSQIMCVFGLTALSAMESRVLTVLHQAAACLVSGFLGAVVALLILPVFERLFRITTDITFLELADLSHPLLQRLALEAPGTYHHSLVVANLAQAAAEEIGASSLRARVCSYFHDIGKLSKPGFFAENIRTQHNPHDKLPPSMSALVITAHVKEGVSLAMLHKLPKPVLDVIREHHGTSLISFFLDKACAQLESDRSKGTGATNGKPKVDEWNFRYAGPKPASPVSGIISLADPVEAASRSLEKVTPTHIEGLVEDIVSGRLDDGQLDECDLTLDELTRIKTAFIFTLTSMLHGRTPYPKDEDRDKQSTTPAPSRTEPIEVPDVSAHG